MSGTEFQTLDQAKAGEKISFIGTIINIGDLKSGTNNTGDYTYKRFLIQDAKATLELTAWDDEIKKFVMGGKYEIINAYAKDYKGKVSLGIQYAEVKLIGTDKQQSTIDETPEQSASLEEKQENPPKVESKIPTINPNLADFVETDMVTLLQIEQEVRTILHHYKPLPKMQEYEGSYVGMLTKEIYREAKKVKFEKA